MVAHRMVSVEWVYPACAGKPFQPIPGRAVVSLSRVCGGTLALLITPPAILFAREIRETQ